MLLKKVVSAAVPAMVAAIAFLNARAVGALVDATVTPSSIAPFAEARAATVAPPPPRVVSGQAILDRNPFDSTPKPTVSVAIAPDAEGDLRNAPLCDGVRAVVTVRADEPDASFAALDVGGKRHLRRRGGEVADLSVVFVGDDRVWLAKNGALCQAKLFAGEPPKRAAASPLVNELASKIERTGPFSYAIDRGAVARLLEAQTELMKTPLVPEKEDGQVVGYRMTRVKPGSVLALLGLEPGDRLEALDGIPVTSAEGLMQAYARLSAGALSHLSIRITRGGKPRTLDYAIK